MHVQTQIWSLYRITNKINGKVYIGQAADVSKRWHDHRRAFNLNKPTQIVHYALIKYGLDNFEFEVIACCKTQDDANYIETELVKQYNSFIKNGRGYNATLGGMNAPKTDLFKQMMRDWHASLSPEERAEISRKQAEATIKQIAEKGHPGQGTKRTDEQKANMSLVQQNRNLEYTPEIRQRMSESHIGHKESEETKKRKSISMSLAWEKRINYDDIKCQVSDCEVSGKHKYRIINGARYCDKHGSRLKRHGTLDKLPPFKYTEDNPMPDDVRKKCGSGNIGRIAHNRKKFTEEQIKSIIFDNRSNKRIAKEHGVTEKVIKRVKLENI